MNVEFNRVPSIEQAESSIFFRSYVVKRAYDTKYRKQNLLIAGRGLNRANKNAMLSVEPKMDK